MTSTDRSDMNVPWLEPSQEQRILCDRVLKLADSLNQGMLRRDQEAILDREVWRRCAEFGIPGLPIPQGFGGGGRDLLTTLLVMKTLGYSCQDNGLVFSMNAQMWAVELPILHFGSDEQKRYYLPRLCSGEFIGAHAISEPEHGSDVMGLATRAVRDGDDYVLNGHKSYVTSGPICDLCLIFATLDPEMKAAGVTAFLVDRGTAGMRASVALPKMGLRTAQMGEITLQDCRVPWTHRLGGEGAGLAIFNSAMEWERTCIFASHLGAMQRLLEQTVKFAKARRQFGSPISKYSPIADKIVDMKIAIEAGELLLYKAAAMKASGKNAVLNAAIAKLFVSEAHVRQALDAMQIHGAYGFLVENEVERELRDAVPGTIYSGTSEMQRKIIARLMGL